MSNVLLFSIGAMVSTVIAAAIGLLIWGASNEERSIVWRVEKRTRSRFDMDSPLAQPIPVRSRPREFRRFD